MARPFNLQLVSRQGVKFEGPVEYLRLPAADGLLGVLADHAPLIVALVPGEIAVTLPGAQVPTYYAGSAGVAEIRDNAAVVLVDTLESADEIDESRARESADRARDRLLAKSDADFDADRAAAALERALARLKVATRSPKSENK